MHKQVSGWTVNFCPNFPESPFLEFQTRKPPPPILENFRFGMTKVYSRIPPLSENFRFGMTKVYSRIPPPFRKLHIWDDQSLLQNTPSPFGKVQIWDDQSLLRNTPPHFGKLHIWDDQSLLQNTPPPFWKTSHLGWPKFTPEYHPPISENFRFGMTKVYSGIPPPILENFTFGMTKVYSRILPPPFWKTSHLGWPKFTPEYHPPISENFRFGMTKVYSGIPPPNENCERVQVREFQNTESYYMWRLYPARITTRSVCCRNIQEEDERTRNLYNDVNLFICNNSLNDNFIFEYCRQSCDKYTPLRLGNVSNNSSESRPYFDWRDHDCESLSSTRGQTEK